MKSKYKNFCIICILFVAGILLYNALAWNLFTRELLTREEGFLVGDLARMGYHSDSTHKRQNFVDLSRQHLDIQNYHGGPVDLLTVGDSFSNMGGGGRNPYYQDYIASAGNLNVLNVSSFPGTANLIETIMILSNSGMLDQLKPRYLLLETVGRSCYRYADSIDFQRSVSLEGVHEVYGLGGGGRTQKQDLDALPDVSFINSGNFKWLLYNVLYRFSPNAFFSKVYKLKLDRPLFGGLHGDNLLFLKKDIDKLGKFDLETVKKVNENINRLARILKEKGIDLYFMAPPDKYDLYRPYIVDSPFKENQFYDHLRPLPKEYHFIDAKEILAAQLKKGVQDVYFIDDTHWSWEASEAIFAQPMFP